LETSERREEEEEGGVRGVGAVEGVEDFRDWPADSKDVDGMIAGVIAGVIVGCVGDDDIEELCTLPNDAPGLTSSGEKLNSPLLSVSCALSMTPELNRDDPARLEVALEKRLEVVLCDRCAVTAVSCSPAY
jgi:hypothetical protein